jgi:alkylation response protein AidB-like acyl-CoA dehydrogenase
MANYYTDNEDLQFYVDRAIQWAPLVESTEYGFRAPDCFRDPNEALEFYRETLSTVGEIAANEIGAHSAAIDHQGNTLVDGEVVEGAAMHAAFATMKQAELHRLCVPRELGGLNAPVLVYFLGGEMIARGDVSAMTHFSFFGGIAMAILSWSIYEGSTHFDPAQGKITECRFRNEIEEISSGNAWGCMDITEPDAGSDMARLRATATQDASGQWLVTGQKIFITSGHAKYHLVIARTEQASGDGPMAGLQGLSMFLVRAFDDLPDGTRKRYVQIGRLEEKLGHHGSVTAQLHFDKTPAQLLGKRGEGFKYMLTLMNNARIGVSFEGIGLMENAFRAATAYAAERKSMGKNIARHEMIADYLDEMRTDIQALRALAVTSAFAEEHSRKLGLLERFASTVTDREKSLIATDLPRLRALSRRLTPLLKYSTSEKAVEIARRAIQIHGGVGYTQDYGVEKLLRDAMVLPIYEGTSQIQSLMAMKDTLQGIIARPSDFAARIAQAQWRSVSARDALERRVGKIQKQSLAVQRFLVTRTAVDKIKTVTELPVTEWRRTLTQNWDPKRDFALAMLHAERLIRVLSDEAIAEILWDQSQAFSERRELLERWIERAEPRVEMLCREITTTGQRLLGSLS